MNNKKYQDNNMCNSENGIQLLHKNNETKEYLGSTGDLLCFKRI